MQPVADAAAKRFDAHGTFPGRPPFVNPAGRTNLLPLGSIMNVADYKWFSLGAMSCWKAGRFCSRLCQSSRCGIAGRSRSNNSQR